MLKSGDRPSVLAIAREHGLPTAYVTSTIYLAFLAPDIVQCIVRGEQPIGLGTKKLLAMAPLSLDWEAQREALGFARPVDRAFRTDNPDQHRGSGSTKSNIGSAADVA
jgi:hypothetical protein